MHDEQSSIYHFFVHLFDKQSIYFSSNLSSQQLRNRLKIAKFELMKFFEYNRFHANEKNVLYQN